MKLVTTVTIAIISSLFFEAISFAHSPVWPTSKLKLNLLQDTPTPLFESQHH